MNARTSHAAGSPEAVAIVRSYIARCQRVERSEQSERLAAGYVCHTCSARLTYGGRGRKLICPNCVSWR